MATAARLSNTIFFLTFHSPNLTKLNLRLTGLLYTVLVGNGSNYMMMGLTPVCTHVLYSRVCMHIICTFQ